MGRWVCLDVGETLIDETRVWGTWADVLGIPRLTFMAALGAAVERGWDYRHVFEIVDAPDWRRHLEAVERRYGGFRPDDLYPDALTGHRRPPRPGLRGWPSSPTSRRPGPASCARWASTSRSWP